MQEFGGFEIRFVGNADMRLAKISAEKTILGIAENWERVRINEGMKEIYIERDTPIDYSEFDGLFEKICKNIIFEQPNLSFNGLAYYANLNVEFYLYQKTIYRNQKKELSMKSISGEYLDGCCPECGIEIFNPEECNDEDSYYCSSCNKTFKFDFAYNEYLWLLQNREFILKSVHTEVEM